MVKEGFKYSNSQFLPNNQPNYYKVIMDLGKSIGTKGETKIQVIVGAGFVLCGSFFDGGTKCLLNPSFYQ